MFKKTVTYEDYNGDQQTEDFYFNLTKVECMEIEFGFGKDATLSGSIKTLINANDVNTVINTIKHILLMSYGKKSPDGKRFIKNQEIRDEFEQSPAFEKIYWELVTDPDKSSEFITGIIPSSLRDSLGNDPKAELLAKMKAFEESKKQ